MDEHMNRIIIAQNFYGHDEATTNQAPGAVHECPLCAKVTSRGHRFHNVCWDCAQFVKESIERRRAEDAVLEDQANAPVSIDVPVDVPVDVSIPADIWDRYVFEIRRHQTIPTTAVIKRKERVCSVCGNMCYLGKGEICSYCRSLVFAGISAAQLRRQSGHY